MGFDMVSNELAHCNGNKTHLCYSSATTKYVSFAPIDIVAYHNTLCRLVHDAVHYVSARSTYAIRCMVPFIFTTNSHIEKSGMNVIQ